MHAHLHPGLDGCPAGGILTAIAAVEGVFGGGGVVSVYRVQMPSG